VLECTALSTHVDPGPVRYHLEGAPGAAPGGAPLGASGRAGLAAFLGFMRRAGVARTLAERLRLPVQQRRSGFTVVQKSLALLAALAAGCRSARDGDFVLAADPLAPGLLGLPRWPHSSQLTRHLRAFGAQHVAALRAAVEDLTASHSAPLRPPLGPGGVLRLEGYPWCPWVARERWGNTLVGSRPVGAAGCVRRVGLGQEGGDAHRVDAPRGGDPSHCPRSRPVVPRLGVHRPARGRGHRLHPDRALRVGGSRAR
jgi:hypothetical protein